ncbi:MAG: AbrB/MazE/SpoVT family DNA-binding domain-containing protein [Nitrososphaerota archaeon]
MSEQILGLTKISKNMQTRIPKEAAERLGLKEGDRVLWILEGGRIYVKKAVIR